MTVHSESDQTPSEVETSYSPSIEVTDDLLQHIDVAPRGNAETYGATPFDKIATLLGQEKVLENIQRLLRDIPNGIPMVIASAVQDTFVKRFWQRLNANDEKFLSSASQLLQESIDLRLNDMLDQGRIGGASPAELLLLQDQLGASSLEMACVTHPYGEKIENLIPMHDAVEYAILSMDGTFIKEPQPTYALKELITDFDGTIIGVLMTRKRDFGKMKNGTIVRERSSFIVRVDADSELVRILGNSEARRFATIVELQKEEQQTALEQFTTIIGGFLSQNKFLEAIPIATTTYAFNKSVEEKNKQLEPYAVAREVEYISHMPDDEIAEAEVQAKIREAEAQFAREVLRFAVIPSYLSRIEDNTSETNDE